MFTLFFVLLGVAAATWGGWLERNGPRKAGVVAALCWCGGLLIAAMGVYLHQLWLMWLGAGVIGGIGLGLGYISPVSTLINWFPDRRGMATGMAIMGFGGGALIGTPLANLLITHFKTPTTVGVWQTLVVLALVYFVVMMAGAFGYRVPPRGWRPEGWTPPVSPRARHDYRRPRATGQRAPHAAVLADLVGAVHECVGRYRRDWSRLTLAAGYLWRAACFMTRPSRLSILRTRSEHSRPAWRPHSWVYFRCSISPVASSGLRCPIASAGNRFTTFSSFWDCSAMPH